MFKDAPISQINPLSSIIFGGLSLGASGIISSLYFSRTEGDVISISIGMGLIGAIFMTLFYLRQIKFWRVLLAEAICTPIILLVYATFPFRYYPEMYILSGAITGLMIGGIFLNWRAAGLCLVTSVVGSVLGGLLDDRLGNLTQLTPGSFWDIGLLDPSLLKTSLFAVVWGTGIGLGIGLSSLTRTRKQQFGKTPKIVSMAIFCLCITLLLLQFLSIQGNNQIIGRVDASIRSNPDSGNTAALLSDLKVNGITVPGFDPAAFFYDLGLVSSDAAALEISAAAQDSLAGVSGNGTLPFDHNTIYRYPVTVRSADGRQSQTYIIQIRRTEKLHRKAIYVLPGIMDSELLSEEGQLLWPKSNLSRQSAAQLYCQPDGRPLNSIVAADPNPADDRYGVLNFFHPMIHQLQRTVSSDYDIIFAPFDWRIDIEISTGKLNMQIRLGHYDQIVLVGYSMGGVIAANYAAKHLTDQKIEHLIAIAAPFWGSPKIALTYMTGETIKVPFLQFYFNKSYYLSSSKNMLSGYQLLPHSRYFQYQSHYLTVETSDEDGMSSRKDIQSYDSALAYLRRNFGMQDFSANCCAFQENFYQYGEHIISYMASKLGNASVIVSTNVPTINRFLITESADGLNVSPLETMQGDGTIPSLSASLGGSLPNHSTYYIDGVNHVALLSDKRILQLITNIINGQPDALPIGITHERID